MTPNESQLHHRRSIRLQGYDYSLNGAYFITICTHARECILGEMVDSKIVLTKIGEAAERCWREIPMHFHNAQTDVFTILPNHIHGIIVLHGDGKTGIPEQGNAIIGTTVEANLNETIVGVRHAEPLPPKFEQYGKPVNGSIPTIVRSFKSAVTKSVNEHHYIPGSPVWQRYYFEHIIRDEDEYRKIVDYINSNPMNWIKDQGADDHLPEWVK